MENVETEEVRKYCVYLITNMVNGKQYCGQTCNGEKHRWLQHVNAAKRGVVTALGRAIRKYGSDCFSVEVFQDGLSKEDVNTVERSVIKSRNLHNNRFGYNMTVGGDQANLTEESIKKVCESKGWKQDPMCGDAYHRVELPTEKICEEYKEGKSTVWLGKKYGADSGTICRRLRLAGVPRRDPGGRSMKGKFPRLFPIDEMREEYEKGSSANDLARKHKCDTKTIIRHMKDAGVPMRTKSEATSLAAPKMSMNRHKSSDVVSDHLLSRLYQEGWSTLQLGKHFGIDQSTFVRRLQNLGVERRPRGAQHTRDRRFEIESERIAHIQQICSEIEEGR